jgi:hypothetical protein
MHGCAKATEEHHAFLRGGCEAVETNERYFWVLGDALGADAAVACARRRAAEALTG